MGNFLGRRAVVIGAGISGLAAAGALAGHFEEVKILERDELGAVPRSRPGVPQGRHPHGLLAGGLKALNTIFPAFATELAVAGAVPVDMGRDVRFERPDVGALPRRDLGISVLCASRPFLECVLRRRIAALPNVALSAKRRVTRIVPAADSAAVRGVELATGSGRSETLTADLVVDASGRGVPTLALLDSLGWALPQTTEIGVDISYATVVVRIPPNAPRDWKFVLTLPDPPALASNAVLLPVEGDRWMVLLADRGFTGRLATWDLYLEALQHLKTPTLYQALRHARPPEEIRHFRFPASAWRHFERLPRLPRGVLPVGDALCRFNPIYGQGMSVAAQEACLLRDVLHRAAAAADPIAALQAGFMGEVASVLETPWGMSTGTDLAFPETRGERPADFADRRQFEAALFRAAVTDPVVHRAAIEVGQLLRHGSRLQEPDMLRRIEAAAPATAAA